MYANIFNATRLQCTLAASRHNGDQSNAPLKPPGTILPCHVMGTNQNPPSNPQAPYYRVTFARDLTNGTLKHLNTILPWDGREVPHEWDPMMLGGTSL